MADVTFDDVSSDLFRDYEELLVSYYKELAPDVAVASGSAVRELVIRPAAAIYARNEVALESLREQYSLNLLAQSADPDDAIADNLAANFKIVRREGTQGAGTVAIYTRQSGDIYISEGARMESAGIALESAGTYVGTLAAAGREDTGGVQYREFIQTDAGERAFTVQVKTVANTDAVIGEGAAVTMAGQGTQISRMELVSAVSGGSLRETAAQLAARVQAGVAAKVPSGKAHIDALLAEQGLTAILETAVIGLGDPEMSRDRNNILCISTGGRADVYCRTSQLPATTLAQLPATRTASGRWSMYIGAATAPGWYYISGLAAVGNPKVITDQAELDITFLCQAATGGPEVFDGPSARFSIYQTAVVEFDYAGPAGTTEDYQVALVHMPGLADLQGYLNSAAVRNPQQDILIRGAVPAYIGMSLGLRQTTAAAPPATAGVAAMLATYVNSLPLGRGFLSVSDLAVAVNTAYPQLVLDYPAHLTMSIYMPDGSVAVQATSSGVIRVQAAAEQGVTGRTTALLCRPGDISLSIDAG